MFHYANVQMVYGWMPYGKRSAEYTFAPIHAFNETHPSCIDAFKYGYYIKLVNLTQSGRNDLELEATSNILRCDSLNALNVYIHPTAGYGNFVAPVTGVYPSYGMQIKSQFALGPSPNLPAEPAERRQNDPGWFECGNWGHNDAIIMANRVVISIPADPPDVALGPFTHYILYKRAVLPDNAIYAVTNANNEGACFPIAIWKIDANSFNWNTTTQVSDLANNCVKMTSGDQFYIKFGGDGAYAANYNGVVLGFDNDPYVT